MMTKKQFVDRAVRAAERELRVPPGWWGTWRDVTDGESRVHFTGRGWRVSRKGSGISDHDSREFAIRKATKMKKTRKR